MKRIIAAIAVLVILAAGFLLGRTLAYRSRQLPVEPAKLIDVDAKAAAEHLAGAIRFKTISHQIPWEFKGTAFTEFHAYLASTYPKVHAALKREVVAQYSLLYTWTGSDASLKPVILLAHQDVVPVDAASAQAWRHPPFGGVVAEEAVWGRGALDDKSSIAGMLEAAEILLGEGFQPKRTIYFAFGHDEELGGKDGAANIAKLLQSRGVHAWFTLDEGSAIVDGVLPGIDRPVALIATCEKGYTTVELKTTAKGGHSSTPPDRTAIGIIARAVARLEDEQMPAQLAGPMLDMLETLGPEMTFPLRLVMANRSIFGPILKGQLLKDPTTAAALRTTTAATIMNAGTKENVLPIEAKAVVNFRILPGDTVEDVLAHVRRVVEDPQVAINLLESSDSVGPSPVSSTSSPAYASIARSIRQVYPGTPVGPGMTLGATDSKRYYAVAENLYRIQPFILTSKDLATIHGTDESIQIDRFANGIKAFAQILRNAGSDGAAH